MTTIVAGDTQAPAVSVVVPVLDVAPSAGRLVASLSALTDPPGGCELVLVDDGSSDGTEDALQAAIDATGDRRFVVVRRAERGGPGPARRTGYMTARGTYVWHADADDAWDRDALVVLHAAATRTGASIVAARAARIEANGRRWRMEGVDRPAVLYDEDIARAVLDGTVRGYLWNKLIRRDLLLRPARFGLRTHEDFVTVLAALEGVAAVALIPDVIYRYHERLGSVSAAPSSFAVLEQATEIARGHLASGQPRWRWDAFEAWFLLIPALVTPAHHGWPAARAATVSDRYRRRLRPRHVVALLRVGQARSAAFALAAKLLGPAFPAAYRSTGRVAGWSIRSGEPGR